MPSTKRTDANNSETFRLIECKCRCNTITVYLLEILQTGMFQLGTDELMQIYHCLDYQELPKRCHKL